jgi:hypothetical protein
VGDTPFIVVDTGGFEPVAKTGILHQMARQTKQAIAEADVVVFLVDARAGLNAHDHDIARLLRKLGQKVVLCVNKAEGMQHTSAVAEFHELALGLPCPISAAHGDGIADLIEHALEGLGEKAEDEVFDADEAEPSPDALASDSPEPVEPVPQRQEEAGFTEDLRHPEASFQPHPFNNKSVPVDSGVASKVSSPGFGGDQQAYDSDMAQNGGEWLKGTFAFDSREPSAFSSLF